MNRTETYIARYIGNFFSVYLCAEKGCSPHTVRSYANALSSYIDFIETTQHIRSERITTAYVTKKLVLEYLSWLEDKKNVSVSTRNQRLAAIHSLCRYLQRVDVPHIDRWQDVLTIKTKKGTAKPMLFLSVDGIRLLLNQIPTTDEILPCWHCSMTQGRGSMSWYFYVPATFTLKNRRIWFFKGKETKTGRCLCKRRTWHY